MAMSDIPSLLIISQGSGFMVNSLKNNIEKQGIMVNQCDASLQNITGALTGNSIVVLLADGVLNNAGDVLPYLSSKCEEDEFKLVVIGYPNELDEIKKNINTSLITAEISRPFDMNELNEMLWQMSYQNLLEMDQRAVKVLPPGQKHHILMCDDDLMFMKMVQGWLDEKYRVSVVRTGVMVVPFAQNNEPELILLDYEMPLMNGTQVLEALRQDKKMAKIPVVFFTGHSDKDCVVEVMRLRPQGYLLKSAKKEDIISSVDHFFATGQWKTMQRI